MWMNEAGASAAIVLDHAADGERIGELHAAAAKGQVVLLDEIALQLAGWDKRVPPPGEDVGEPTTRWVHYPWRRTAVHVLGPPHFDLLRLDRNRNKITRTEQERFRQLGVAVVGLSVGHAIAHTLALEGLCGRLTLADFDEIELSNLNRIPASLVDLGGNKAVAAARRIAETDPYLPVRIIPTGATADTYEELFDGIDVVVEECDSLDVKLSVRAEARRRRVTVLMETSDLGMLDVERFDLDPDRPLLHGLIGATSAEDLAGLTTEQKVPYIMAIIDGAQMSARFGASMVEVDRTVSTWPQLGSDVALGGATIATALRRYARGELRSGRIRISLDGALDQLEQPTRSGPVSEDAVPRPDPAAEPQLGRRLAAAGALAPSAGNMQPWSFTWSPPVLHVLLDRTRKQTLLDVGARGSLVAAGAALESVAVFARAEGRPVEVVVDPDAETLVGSVQVGEPDGSAVDDDVAHLATALTRRWSNRRIDTASPRELPDGVAGALRAVAMSAGGALDLLESSEARRRYGEIAGRSDRLRYLTPRLQVDLLGELRWRGESTSRRRTGIEVATLELAPADEAKLTVIRRGDIMAQVAGWDLGTALTEPARDALDDSCAVFAISVAGHERRDFVAGGRVLQQVWLTATTLGLSAQPVSPIWLYAREEPDFGGLLEDPRHAAEARELDRSMSEMFGLGDRALVMVMRLSNAPPPSAVSGRLPLDDVLDDGAPS